ncbi:MAG: MATE family efflux transporter [Clostridia bacterium]|nr:MATE family efflux transporter [Clostridia bacterium]
MALKRGSATLDMTSGSIIGQIILFSLPLMLGNIFQMLYNTVDSVVVGNFVGKEALAAVGSTTMIVNMLVFFFNGFSVGAGVVIAQHFGARDMDRLHSAVETTMAVTFVLCALFTLIGVFSVRPMLRLMSTPDDVFEDAVTYLTIYFWGFTGLLIYNIGSGILRAVGDTTRPLMFLVLTSLLNIVLDLVFVIGLKAGIAGVALATIISQFISAALTLRLLTATKDIYRLVWKDLRIELPVLRRIFAVGLPAGIQSVITAFSNVFVQSYVNHFGSSCMAGWSCYNKLDQFIMLPMSSTAMAATTFVSQNIGAKQYDRANRGTWYTILLSVGITLVIAVALVVFAGPAVGLFTRDPSVIEYGVLFMRANTFFLLFNCVNHTLAGALRGRGDSRGPMVIMLGTFVAIRQVYLFLVTRYVANTPFLVGFGYPVGWMCCCALEVTYYFVKWGRKARAPEPIQ